MCSQVCLHMHVHVETRVDIGGLFFNDALPYLSRQGLSLNLQRIIVARLAISQASGIHLSPPPSAEVTNVFQPSLPFIQLEGTQTQVPVFA